MTNRIIRWVHVQPDDVTNFVDDQRIGREFEGLAALGLQAERTPDAVDRRPTGFRHVAHAPVRAPRGVVSSVQITTRSICSSVILRAPDGAHQTIHPAASPQTASAHGYSIFC
jgi:hypothetical protein